MQAQRNLVCVAVGLVVSACCFGGSAATAPTAPAAPSGPAPTAPAGCPDVATAIVGTWQREGFTEEYREGGVYVINGREGTYSWLRPGHALLDVPGAMHAEYDLGLASASELIAIDPNRAGTVYTRVTPPPPSADPSCYDFSTRIVGAWVDPTAPGTPERYDADGTYQVGGHGRWSFTSPGHLHLVRDDGVTSDYLFAIVSPTGAVAIGMPPLEPRGSVYTRQ